VRYVGRAHFKCQFQRYSELPAAMGYLLAPQCEPPSIKCLALTLDSSACRVMLPRRHTSGGSEVSSRLEALWPYCLRR